MNETLTIEQPTLDLPEFCEYAGVLYRSAIDYDTRFNYPQQATRDGQTWTISIEAADRILRNVTRLPSGFTGGWERIVLTDIGEELDVIKSRLPSVLLTEDKQGYFHKQLYPVVMAEVCGNGQQCRVRCDFCSKFHIHGNGDGHRACHCFTENSPYKKTGYILYRVQTLPPQPQRWPVKRTRFGEVLATCPVELLEPKE